MERKQRVSFYIDGFNFYFGLRSKSWRSYYWLDLVKFCNQFLKPHQELVEVNYFSAVVTNKGKHDRQGLFFSANRLNPQFNLYLGKFLSKDLKCTSCKSVFKTFEEKQTDVHIATKIIRDCVLDRCDVSIIISADSDLTPPIDFIREYDPSHKIIVYFPPSRFSYDLKNKANSFIKLENHEPKFRASLLNNSIQLPSGYILERPIKWH